MSMLTTIDNPYNPYTNYDAWYAYDTEAGYNTNEYLARIAATTPSMSDKEIKDAIESAIDEILRVDPFGIYIRVIKKE